MCNQRKNVIKDRARKHYEQKIVLCKNAASSLKRRLKIFYLTRKSQTIFSKKGQNRFDANMFNHLLSPKPRWRINLVGSKGNKMLTSGSGDFFL